MAKGRRTFWWIAPSLCAALGAGLGLFLYYYAGSNSIISITEGALLAGLLFCSIATAFLLINSFPTKVGLIAYSVVVATITGITAVWLHGAIGQYAEGVQYHYQQGMLLFRAILYLAALLLFSITTAMQRRLRELENRYAMQQDAVVLLKEAELFKLRQQMQPHFLYNSLNAVSSLIITEPDRAEEMIGRLSDFMRASVKQGRSDTVSLEEELNYLRNYLWIESARFGERLQVSWHGLEAAPGNHIPPFLLQPLLENAIKFGLYEHTGVVTIEVALKLQDSLLSISVSNPFDADAKQVTGTGFGIDGIRRRLYLMYARQDLLRTSIGEGLFTATLLIPQ